MNIIFGNQAADYIKEKYTVLPLDTFDIENKGIETAYCVLENIPIMEINTIENFKKLHVAMMEEYSKKNWKFCEDALEHLNGKWNGELDSFYGVMYERIKQLKDQISDDWTPVIKLSSAAVS